MRNIKQKSKMKSKQVVLPLLLIYSIVLASAEVPAAQNQTTTEPTLQERTNKTSSTASLSKLVGGDHEDGELMSGSATLVNDGQQNEQQDQVTSPSMTSVHHQVWTSSSSGSLDELSPEIISKLRNDVPFLAAYALRPRLVGASSTLTKTGEDESQEITKRSGLLASASQQSQRRQISGLPLVSGPSLSDFNELKVETSSTSKSEHHHNRKTTLKKQPTSGDQSNRRRLILAATSKLMIERRRKSSGNKRNTLSASKRSKSNKQSGRLRSQASKLRRKLNRSNRKHHMSIIRHGRQQQAAISPPLNKLPDGGKTNLNEDDGVKGGSKRVEPFYKRRKEDKPTVVDKKDEEEEEPHIAINDLDGDRGERGDDEKQDKKSSAGPERDEEAEDDQAQLDPPEPRRVGDPDVDEVEGDTVTVMPKFDGVDDDPEIPIEESEPPQGGATSGVDDADEMTREREAPQNDERGRRVGREKSNEEGGGGSGGSMVAGGGIGATTGGSSSNGDSGSDSRKDDDADQSVGSGGADKDADAGGKKSRTEPGVEFARDDDEDVDDKPRESAGERAGSKGDRMEDEADEDRVGERPFDSRRVGSDGGDRRDDTADRDERRDGGEDSRDVDYREDSDKKADAGSKDKGDSGAKEPAGSDADSREPKRTGDHDDDRGDKDDKSHHDKRRPDCDDQHGHYDHHDHEHHGHHSHHDGIKWLQDAIPGEPGQDYPILSRVNLTNFNCRDQKYAGYYADVESRCQIFHICQADGRQDSFLCPNGTIFSQISRVCVWWNSFDCEEPRRRRRASVRQAPPKLKSRRVSRNSRRRKLRHGIKPKRRA